MVSSIESTELRERVDDVSLVCRWDDCVKFFYTLDDLIEHVSEDHVRTCSPICYGDYLILCEREEREAAGQSMSTGIISFATDKLTQEPAAAGSLPSPPASSDVEDDPMSNHDDNESDIYYQRSHSPPPFGALSSPMETPEPLFVPDSPNFDQLVANATRGTKRKLDTPHSSDNSQSSQDSTQSQDFVAQQLTQVDESDDEFVLDDSGHQSMKTEDEEDPIDTYTLDASVPRTQHQFSQYSSSSHQPSPKPIRTYGRSFRQSSSAPQVTSQPVSPPKYRTVPVPQCQQWYSVDPRSLHEGSQRSGSVDSSRMTPSSRSGSYQIKQTRVDSLQDLDIGGDDQENSYSLMTQAHYSKLHFTSSIIWICPTMSTESSDSTGNPLAVANVSHDLLIVVFIHGFKGDDETFGKFPQRLQHILTETIPSCNVECVVFPAYENEAVTHFADWLTTLTVEKEVAYGGAGKAKIVLCGHSMGGLLAADGLLEFVKSRPDTQAPLWPKIIACIAFDTPYLGLHPFVFKNSATKAIQYANSARAVGSALFGSFAAFGAKKNATEEDKNTRIPVAAIEAPPSTPSAWSKWGPGAYAIGGALAAGAAAGGAYYRRNDLGVGYTWMTDHMKYVGNLWDEKGLEERLDVLIEVEKTQGVLFRVYYTLLPAVPLLHDSDRTFIMLPKVSSKTNSRDILAHFLPAVNNTAPDELQAHTGMFGAHTNDGYYKLGLETAGLIREAVMIGRGVVDPELTKETAETAVQADADINAEDPTHASSQSHQTQ
ncbi:hypothetical protein D9758_004748 [Tetrapyrgos nigripes]|uniref:C2H2-type domain-containing protein n=1 Tax=Tetrapyrgos nigripes TaxID=182062 RepID=A0A8H5G5W4_9AGAR|nr:hypothetical protein D9758_004748 [Tetrapyrgos nigripes]